MDFCKKGIFAMDTTGSRKSSRRLLAILLAATVQVAAATPALAASATTAGTTATSYSDVSASLPQSGAITALSQLGILSGYPGGLFKPDGHITRAEMAKVLDVTSGLVPEVQGSTTAKSPYTDVTASDWFAGYVNESSSAGYFKGYPNGTFQPGAQVSDAEVATVLVRFAGASPLSGGWPQGDIAEAQQLGLLNGVSDFSANAPATRADVAQMVANLLGVLAVGVHQMNALTSANLQAAIPYLQKDSQGLIQVLPGITSTSLTAAQVNGVRFLIRLYDHMTAAGIPISLSTLQTLSTQTSSVLQAGSNGLPTLNPTFVSQNPQGASLVLYYWLLTQARSMAGIPQPSVAASGTLAQSSS